MRLSIEILRGSCKDLLYFHCKFDCASEAKLGLGAYVTIHDLANLLAELQSNTVPIRIEPPASFT